MATNTAVCSICDLRHLTKPSTDWCPVCEEALCSDCREHHGLSRATRDHKVMCIADYHKLPENILEIKQYCGDHGDKYQMFCQKHDSPICSKCIESHVRCGDIIPLDKVIANAKKSTSFEDLVQSVADLEENIKRIKRDREKNISSIEEQKKKCHDEIKKARQKINEYLDKMEKQLIKELAYANDNATQTVKSVLNLIDEKENQMVELKVIMQNIKQYASDLQTFLGMREIQSAVVKEERYIQSLVDAGSLNHVNISCSTDTELENILANIKNIGSVQLQTRPSAIKLISQKEKQAQMMTVAGISINEIKLSLLQIVNLGKYVTYTRGCCLTPTGGFLFSCRNRNKLVALNPDGSFNIEVSLYLSAVFGVTSIDEKTVGITSDSEARSGVSIIDLITKQTTFIDLHGGSYGLATTEASIVVCVNGKGIHFINREDLKLSMYAKSTTDQFSKIAVYNDVLYYTCYYKNTVTCCDFEGQNKWVFRKETILTNPSGIAVNDKGNVYVAGEISVNVVVISSDGEQVRELLTRDDGLTKPSDISFDSSNKRLLVTNSAKTALLFDVA